MLGSSPSSAFADGLKSAQVSRIFNDVRLLPENQPARPAVVSDTITGRAAVQTGSASRTELTFSDLTLTRLGANSYFSFVNGTRDINLQSGTMLLQVPKNAGGATIHTAGITAGITGTTLMVEYNPKSYSKVVVLEGTVRVSLNGNPGESLLVHAGQIMIVPSKAKSLPDPVNVDLKKLYATSGLITNFGPLPSRSLIDQEIGQQTKKLGAGQLQNSDLFIAGVGTQVQAGNLAYVATNNTRITAQQGPDTPVTFGGRNVASSKYGALNLVAGNDAAQVGTYDINATTTIRTDPYITTNGKQDTGRIYRGSTTSTAAAAVPSPDGTPSVYLLGAAATGQFTPASSGNFDTYFGAVGNIAAFHFSSFALLGTPVSISTADGPTNLALIADTGITGPSSSGTTANAVVSLNGLGELLLATRQGSISLDQGVTFQNTDGTTPNLTFYAQGGTLNLGAGTAMNVGGRINLHSDTGITLGGTVQAGGNVEALSGGPLSSAAGASIASTGGQVELTSVNGTLALDGAIRSASIVNLLSPGGALAIDGTVASTGELQATAAGDIAIGAGASLVSSGGQVYLQSTGGTATFNGTVNAQGQAVLEASGDVTAGGTARLTSSGGNVYLYSGNGTATNGGVITAGGAAYLEGATVVQNGTVTAGGGLFMLSNGNLTVGGTATAGGTGNPATATLQGFGTTTLNAAQLSADTLKLQVFGNNGTLLIGGGSTLTGNSQLNLFAGGAGGRIEFTGNTVLNSNVAAILTASVIRIDNNVTVTINGPTALLYANTLQFGSASGGDGSTTGSFGGNGAVQAGNYTAGAATARATAGGAGATTRASTTSNRPGGAKVVPRTVPSSYDGRFGLSTLVNATRVVAAATATPGGARREAKPKAVGKTASAASGQSQMPPTTVLR